jgi:alkylglycerol monooxygenase
LWCWTKTDCRPELRLPVAAYVLVIATMAAQAWGRAKHLGSAGSRWVAWGSVLFMLSDALLAMDKFVSPLPLAGLWVLASYYLAQGLIVQGRLSLEPYPKAFKAA